MEALRLAHQAMLERQAGGDTGPPETIPPDEIAAFTARVQAAGTAIRDPDERRLAQRIIDYWAADLVAASRSTPVEFGPVQLAPFAPPEAEESGTGASARSEGSSMGPEDARHYIRISALARQWRESDARGDGSSRGYLLSGDALLAAERFERDPDIAALIAASREAEREVNKRRQRAKNMLIAVMTLAIMVLSALSFGFYKQRQAAEAARDFAEEAGRAALDAQAETEAARLRALDEREQALAALRDAEESAANASSRLEESLRLQATLRDINMENTARLAAERSRQRVLDAAADIIAAQIEDGDLDWDDVDDESLQSMLRPRLSSNLNVAALPGYAAPTPPDEIADDADDDDAIAAVVDEATDAPAEAVSGEGGALDGLSLDGYDPGFLGIPLPLPSLTEQQASAAWQGGEPLPYHHFSIVVDGQRRTPLVAATNLDRLAIRTLPQAPEPIPRPDPRLPEAVQPGPQDFASEDLVQARLVDPHEISWGDDLPTGAVAAAEFVAEITSLFPNLVPQHEPVQEGAWRVVEEWVRERHNPAASRVTVLAGPVMGRHPVVPAAFWKVAISTQEGLYKDPAQAQIVVDAFLVPNDPPSLTDRTGDGLLRGAESFRTTLDQITVRTGLRFPSVVAEATRTGERLAARLASLDGQTEAERKQLVQEVLNLLRSPTAAAADQRTVCAALLNMAEGGAVSAMSPQGRVNLFFLLSQIPAATWDRAAWLPLKGQARWAVASLDVELGPEARGYLDALRDNLGAAVGRTQTVYLQFAGMTREDAGSLADRLRTLGWEVPGEERRPERVNQVRYNPSVPEDAAAARLLAADLDASGFPGVEPVGLDIIRPGIVEVWVSR